MNETIEMEIVPPVDEKLVRYAVETGLEKTATETLVEAFRPVFAKSREALATARGVAESVKDATCVTEIRKSRACRLAIRAVRLESDETRKKHKQHALLYGRAVDGFHNILLADLAPVETALQEAEDVAERAEAARKAALKDARAFELQTVLDGPWMGADLGEMPILAYVKILEDAKLLKQAKFDAAVKVETERKARIETERIERERITAENARLKEERVKEMAAIEVARRETEAKYKEESRLAKLEADRIQEVARKEREAIEAKAKSEREKAAKEAAWLKAELAAKEKAEALRKAEVERERLAAEKAARVAAAAPDVAKLRDFALSVRELNQPALRNQSLGAAVGEHVEALAMWLDDTVSEMEAAR